ncbi:type II secretion system F family protein [Bacteriovoracaceae bacterium]|nr:type II secretion system F family protein [Bacteriovoracaceae bacterium]
MIFSEKRLSLSKRQDLYEQMETYLTSGSSLREMFKHIQNDDIDQNIVTQLRQFMDRGYSWQEALKSLNPRLPNIDIILLNVGEQSGELPRILQTLSIQIKKQQLLRKHILSSMPQTILLFHMAVLVFPTIRYFSGSIYPIDLIWTSLVPLLVFYFLSFWVYRNLDHWFDLIPTSLESLFLSLPIIGELLRTIDFHAFLQCVWLLNKAGSSNPQIFSEAKKVMSRSKHKILAEQFRKSIEKGELPPQKTLDRFGFPSKVRSYWNTGLISGTLDQQLERSTSYLEGNKSYLYEKLANWISRSMYVVVVIIAFSSVYQMLISQLDILDSIDDF